MRRFRAVIAVALVAAACNGSPEETGTFVDGMCTAMGTWIDVLQGGNDELQQDLAGITSAEQAIELLVGYLDRTVEATDELIADVEALGPPDVDGGEDAQASILETFEGVRTALADAADEVRGLDTSDPQALADALTTLSSDLTDATGELVGPLARTTIPELEQAYADSQACDVIKSLGE